MLHRLALLLLCALAAPPLAAVERLAQAREEIELLATPEELATFDALDQDWRREAFLRRFWELRDPFPQTARNELQERWESRAEAARQRFGTLDDDRSGLWMLHGEPAKVTTPHCGGLLRRIEVWSWPRADLVPTAFAIVVRLEVEQGETRGRVWDPVEGLAALAAGTTPLDDAAFAEHLLAGCTGGTLLLEALGQVVRWPLSGPERRSWPAPDPEWALAFADRTTRVDPEAAPLAGLDVELSFPARRQSRTVVRALLSVPRDAIEPSLPLPVEEGRGGAPRSAPKAAYRFVVDGEVLREGTLFDSFRYRFELPVEAVGDTPTLAIPLERALRAARYTLAVRVREIGGAGRETRWEGPLVVPATVAASPVVAETSAPAAEAPSAVEAQAPESEPQDTVVRLLPPPPGLQTGLVKVAATVDGPVAGVVFELDGKPLLRRTRPPWGVELDLGRVPRTRRLKAIAVDDQGATLAADAVVLNAGPHRFAVRLVEPRRGSPTGSTVRIAAEVEVPDTERLERVELLLGDDLVATLYQPPFIQTVELPQLEGLGWVRAVAVLESGASAEDIVFVNAPDLVDSIDIDLVELYTTVVDRRGRPVEGLQLGSFAVSEDGREQLIRRFELIRDTPLHAGIVLDVSASMREELAEAEAAALAFFADLLRPTDRACVVTFSDQPELRVRFTNDLGVLAGGLAGMVAEGQTALWDTVVYSLFYFNGIRGKRAVVLVSDGEDSGSRHSFDEALDFARRSGVAIYSVALGRASKQGLARSALARLASETGGRFFEVGGARDLRGVYRRIDEELRSQYLLAYQSDGAGEEFREVEVEVEGRGLTARTISGYFP